MAFRVTSICDNWFSNLAEEDPLKFKFDYYYLCTLLGLAASRKRKPGDDAKEIVGEFLISYRPYQRQLIGLLLVTHLNDLRIELDEKKAVAEQVMRVVAPMSSSQLTDEGFALLNAYCQGGFELLSENLDKPHKMIFFLQKYYDLLDESVRENPIWAAPFAVAAENVQI